MYRMYAYLQQKPLVGAASGIGAGILQSVRYLLTNDVVLKLVSGVATWAGCAVAILTFIAWSIKVFLIIKNYKIKKS